MPNNTLKLKYTNSGPNLFSTVQTFHGITLSNKTKVERSKIKMGIDSFARFNWRGYDSFDNFGAFIINEKGGSLKFYNGPEYSNEYTKPMYSSANGNLTGITFNRQQISFKVGVYWITEKHYRHFINWLNPYEVNDLSFDYEDNYKYFVKLSKVENGTRYFLGYDENNEKAFYTELTLTFEIQGDSLAIAKIPYLWTHFQKSGSEGAALKHHVEYISTYDSENNGKNGLSSSDLDTPIVSVLSFDLDKLDIDDESVFTIDYKVVYNGVGEYSLFSFSSKNLWRYLGENLLSTTNSGQNMSIKYDSSSGLLFLQYGSGEYFLLSLLNTTSSGERLIESQTINKFYLPGNFNNSNIDYSKFSFKVVLSTENANDDITEVFEEGSITSYARTNLI